MEKFNQTKYVVEYRKQHKAQFNVDLNKSEKDELDSLLKEKNLTKVEFIRLAIEALKTNQLKKKK